MEKNTTLIRDKYSKALLFTDVLEIKNYNAKKFDQNKLNNLEKEVFTLRQELKEIKDLLIKRN